MQRELLIMKAIEFLYLHVFLNYWVEKPTNIAFTLP